MHAKDYRNFKQEFTGAAFILLLCFFVFCSISPSSKSPLQPFCVSSSLIHRLFRSQTLVEYILKCNFRTCAYCAPERGAVCWKMVLAIFAFLLLCGTALADLSSEYKNKSSINNNFMVYWTHNASTDMMHIAVEVKTVAWVSLAFTEAKSSSMKDYDACIYSSSQLRVS